MLEGSKAYDSGNLLGLVGRRRGGEYVKEMEQGRKDAGGGDDEVIHFNEECIEGEGRL